MLIEQLIPFIKDNQNEIKIHCATGSYDKYLPKNILLSENGIINFKEWQERQTQKNFERKYVFSMVYLNCGEWLFAGIYESLNVNRTVFEDNKSGYKYETKLLEFGKELIGRLVITFKKSFRASYLRMEAYIGNLELAEIRKEYMRRNFPGYDKVNVSWKELSIVIETDSWKTALENQKGVYLITDESNGKRYVGAAYGNDMILGRWRNYISNGHGSNKKLKELDFEYIKQNFRYSILEIFKSTTDDETIIERESWWKDVLMTRSKFGYNDN